MAPLDASYKKWDDLDVGSEDEGPTPWPRPPGSDEAFAAAANKKAGVATALNYVTTRCDTPIEAAEAFAELIIERLEGEPDLVLCAGTDVALRSTYEELILRFKERPLLFRRLRVVQMDEWCGLRAGHPRSCEHFLREHLIGPLKVTPDRFLHLNGAAASLESECRRVASALDRWGGVSVAALAMGANGRVGFHEVTPESAESPADVYDQLGGVRVLDLSAQLQSLQMVESRRDVPEGSCRQGISLGLRDLLGAKSTAMLVLGAQHADALRDATKLPISAARPASTVLRRRQLWVAGYAAAPSDTHLIADLAACPMDAAEEAELKRESEEARLKDEQKAKRLEEVRAQILQQPMPSRAEAIDAEPPPEEEPPPLPPVFADGCFVRISGIAKRPELNETYGFVRGWHASKERFAVELEGTGERVLLKAEALEDASEAAALFPRPLHEMCEPGYTPPPAYAPPEPDAPFQVQHFT